MTSCSRWASILILLEADRKPDIASLPLTTPQAPGAPWLAAKCRYLQTPKETKCLLLESHFLTPLSFTIHSTKLYYITPVKFKEKKIVPSHLLHLFCFCVFPGLDHERTGATCAFKYSMGKVLYTLLSKGNMSNIFPYGC